MILNVETVARYFYNAGFRGTALRYAIEICRCESGFNTNAHNTSGEDSRGLMQINVAPGANVNYKNYDLFDPGINARVAFEIYQNAGNTFRDWTCARRLGLVDPGKSDLFFSILSIALISGIVLYLT